MSLGEKLMAQGGKPCGLLGRLIGSLMNLSHSSIYRWVLDSTQPGSNSTALDIGCGGGQAIRLLARGMPGSKVYGIDHSPEMVSLAQQVNRSFIESGRVEIEHGSVSSLPYADDVFDLVTAFETIQFWPDLDEDLRQVRRVLKSSGTLLIANRYPDLEGQNANWAEVLQIRSAEEYRQRLSDAGFADIAVDDRSRPGWILVSARKP